MSEYLSNRQRKLNIGITSYTENQLVLDVTGDANISGITTIGDITINSGIITSSNPGITTVIYYGDGSHLIGVNAFNVVTQEPNSNPVYPTFANNIGVSSVGISSEQFVFIPASGSIGIGLTTPTSKLHVIGDALISGVVTATTFYGNLTGTATTSTDIVGGIGSLTSLIVSGVSTLPYIDGTNIAAGIVTATTFYGNLTGTATTATKLENIRTFEITGDIIATTQDFDGTQNVSLASSIQPNTVGMGTHTYGDYVKNITGTVGQIDVSPTFGEGSSPQIGLTNDVTIFGSLNVNTDIQVDNDLNVNGNITIGGTTALLNVSNLLVKDKDIVSGYTQDVYGNDISTDISANTGGIAVASTEGSPIVNLNIVGIETLPPTYKKLMWFKENSFVGLGTDAWMFNYGVGIGSTQIPYGIRLAVGDIQFNDRDLVKVRNINASGIVTGSTFIPSSGFIKAPDGTNSIYIYSGSGNVSFQGTIGVGQINNASGYKVIGFASTDVTFENNAYVYNNLYVSGITSSTNGFYGNLTGTATTATNVVGGIGSLTTLTVSSLSTLSNVSAGVVTATQFSTGIDGIGINTNTIYGPSVMIIDPSTVGDNTGVLRIKGDFYVDGTQTVINSSTLEVADLQIGIGTTAINDVVLDGAGIGVGSLPTRKTFTWEYTTSSFKSSENINLSLNKTYKINGVDVLSSTTLGANVVNSSLTSVGTLVGLNVSGTSTLGNVTAGIITASSFIGNLTGTATTATNLSDAANITTGTISASRLSGFYGINVSYATTSGISTVAQGLTGTPNITVGVVTASSFIGNLTGTATTATNVIGGIGSLTSLTVSGSSTLGNVTAGIVTASSFVGSGSSITDLRVGIQSSGSIVGYAGTINFTGIGISSVNVSSNVATISIPATVRTTSYTVAYEGQTIFPCSYTIGYIEVFFNGSKLSPTQYNANDGANVVLIEPASANDVIETIGYNGVLALSASKTILTDVSADGLTFYTGKAAVGIATTAASWTIRRSLFSSAGIVTSVGIARNIAWSNRTSGIYT